MKLTRLKTLLFTSTVTAVLAISGFSQYAVASAATDCSASPLPTTLGTVSETVTVPSTGSYQIWSRILAPDSSNNTFYMQITSSSTAPLCDAVVGSTSTITPNTWTWVDQNLNVSGSPAINESLTAGTTYTILMAGKGSSVELDRLILTGDTTCVPTGTGDNCAHPPDTTPPVVSISSPANNATVSGTAAITVAASDDVAVAKVELYVDGALQGTDTTSPYSFSLVTTSLTPGNHTLLAKAYDTSNNVTSSTPVTVKVLDTTPPTVSITSPANGATVSGTTALTATAADNVGVTKVEFYVDGTLKATDTTSPYSDSLDTTTLTNASHSVTAKAYDAAGNSTTSTAVSMTVNNPVTPPPDTTPPTASITSPVNGATVIGTTTVNVTATDNVGVTKVEFYVDGTLKSTDTTAPYSYALDTTTLSNASHSITAKAYDAAGNSTTSTPATSITVVNYLPEDINQDGHINLLDFSALASKFGQGGAGVGRADIDGNGTVNLLDFSLLASKYGSE